MATSPLAWVLIVPTFGSTTNPQCSFRPKPSLQSEACHIVSSMLNTSIQGESQMAALAVQLMVANMDDLLFLLLAEPATSITTCCPPGHFLAIEDLEGSRQDPEGVWRAEPHDHMREREGLQRVWGIQWLWVPRPEVARNWGECNESLEKFQSVRWKRVLLSIWWGRHENVAQVKEHKSYHFLSLKNLPQKCVFFVVVKNAILSGHTIPPNPLTCFR